MRADDAEAIMNKWIKKLRSQAGESIGETLVALLISSLALVMLAGAVSAATRIVLQSKDAMQDYYDRDKKMVTASASPSTGKTTIRDADASNTIEDSADIIIYANDKFQNTPVYSYTVASNP